MQQSICPSDGYATLSGHRNRKELAACCCSVGRVMMSCYGKHNKSRNNIGEKYITWRKLVNNYLTLLFLLVLLNN